jgi:hypothetical protein
MSADIDHDDFMEKLLEGVDDSWDGDDARESIAIDYVRYLESQVRRLDGCLRHHCDIHDDEPVFNRYHHYYHTPNAPDPACQNCRYLRWVKSWCLGYE